MVLKTITLNDIILAVISYNRDEIFGIHPWAFQLVDLTEVRRNQQRRLERTANEVEK